MTNQKKGTLIIIGGHEDKKNEKVILKEVARRVGSGKLVICTAATHEPDAAFQEYENLFRKLGVRHVWHLTFSSREQAKDEKKFRILEDATGVFFTGGDQLALTSQMGDTPCFHLTNKVYENGGLIAGTSAGASVMCETMMVGGGSDKSHRLEDAVRLAAGLGFIEGVIIDQHFAERGRIGRLLGVIAQNPKNIGLGIDEDTAVVVENDHTFFVIGSGAVYVIDCTGVSASNIADEDMNKTMAIHGVQLHLLTQGHMYDLRERMPRHLSAQLKKKKLPEQKAQGAAAGQNE